MSLPFEYAEIDDLILNGTGEPWWCDFDLSAVPIWGSRTTKGQPSIPVPHTDGDLAATVHRGPITFTMLGLVYGDFDQDGAPVDGDTSGRVQLQENLEALMALVASGTKTFTYILGSSAFAGDVTVVDLQSGSNPDDPPLTQRSALKIHLPSGILLPSGS